jgi:hypothetical protein
MTRIAIIPTLTDGEAGLWSVARSEGRVPMNWGALLAANGYEVVIVSNEPDWDGPRVPGVTFASPDAAPEVDWVLFGSTSVLPSNWFGRYTVRTKRVVRLQWPTGARIDASGDILAVTHPTLAAQVADEAGVPHESIHVLPSPTLPYAWWASVCGINAGTMPVKDHVLWGAREGFGDRNGGSYVEFGAAALAAIEELAPPRGLRPFVLSQEQYEDGYGPGVAAHRPAARFRALGAVLTSNLPLGSVLLAMRRSLVAITLPAIMGPTLTEAIFEDCAPLVWVQYGALFPDLVEAARKHGVLLTSPTDIRPTLQRLLDDHGMRAAYVDSCKFAFAENSPAKCVDKWRFMEHRVG